jgi:hypothetical protein
MFDFTPNLVPLSPDSDDRPLPERIAAQWNFPLAHKDHEDGRRYYAVQDWIAGVGNTPHARTLWEKLKKRAKKQAEELEKKGKEQLSRWWGQLVKLPYRATDGKDYKMDYADAETLYRITQRMDANTGRRNEILAYLAKAGVVVDEMYRDPDIADEVAKFMRENKEYRKLRTEGFDHDEALQWLRVRNYGIGTRKWITDIWVRRDARGKEIAILTNKVSQIVHGKTATRRKQGMGLAKHDTPRNYDAAADQLLTAITELSAGTAHEWRDSQGLEQLSEDVEDTRPIVDGARPGVFSLFSKKPRRLPGENKPQIGE